MNASGVSVEVVRHESGAVLVVVGEIDAANVDVLAHHVTHAIEVGGVWTIDLSAVEYMDSQAVRVLFDAAQAHLDGAIALTLVVRRESAARDVVVLTGLSATVPVVDAPDADEDRTTVR